MSTLENLPAALEVLRVYLKRAEELKRANAIAAFSVRAFAMQIGMSLRDRLKATDMQFLIVLMDELERERQALSISSTGEEQERSVKTLALDLYARAKGNDKPDISHPHPSNKWTIMEAPRVAQAFHASAVLFDALRQFDGALTPQLEETQLTAHRRSQQLAGQLSRALSSPPCVPPEWRPFPSDRLAKAKPAEPKPASPSVATPSTGPTEVTAPPRPSGRGGMPLLPETSESSSRLGL